MARSGTDLDSDFAVPGVANIASGPTASEPEPRSAALPVCSRSETRIFRMRSRSASYRVALAASGHHGPSVRLSAGNGARARPPSPIVGKRGTYVAVLPTRRIVHTQFSPTGQEPIGVVAPSPGGAGPYVVERFGVPGATNAGGAGSPKYSNVSAMTLSSTGVTFPNPSSCINCCVSAFRKYACVVTSEILDGTLYACDNSPCWRC